MGMSKSICEDCVHKYIGKHARHWKCRIKDAYIDSFNECPLEITTTDIDKIRELGLLDAERGVLYTD